LRQFGRLFKECFSLGKNLENSKWKANADSIRKVAETRYADEAFGSYPTSPGTFTSSFASMPNGVTVNASEVSAAPTYSDAETDAKDGRYSVNYCTGGLIIYYPQGPSTVASYSVGSTSSCS